MAHRDTDVASADNEHARRDTDVVHCHNDMSGTDNALECVAKVPVHFAEMHVQVAEMCRSGEKFGWEIPRARWHVVTA